MRWVRAVLALVLVAAGCELEPADPPIPERPTEAPGVEVPDSIDAAVSSTSPPVAGAAVVPGLVVTIGDEMLRLDATAVEAVDLDTLRYLGPSLVVVMGDEAAERFAALTAANLGKQAVVTLDGSVLSALSVQGRIAGGRLSVPILESAPADLEARVRSATGTR